MNTPAFQLNLNVPITPSRQYAGLLCGLHLLAILVIALAHLPPWLTVLALAGCLFNALWALWGWHGLQGLNQLSISGDQLTLIIDGEPHLAILNSPPMVHPVLTVLDLRAGGRRWWLPLFADSAHPEDLRRLRVWLRRHAHLPNAPGAER